MSAHRLSRMFLAGAAIAVLVSASAMAAPNFNTNTWVLEGGTQFNKVPGDTGPGPIVNKPGYEYKHGDVNRVADTTHPLLRPWAKQLMDQANTKVLADGIPFVTTSRCWAGGVPGILLYPEAVVFLQTPKEVIVMNARYELRHVYLNQLHSQNPRYSAYGEEVGHYDGDALVIDTIGLDDKVPIDRYRTPMTKQAHVVETIRLKNGGKLLNDTFTYDDPGTFTGPWKAQVEFAPGKGERASWHEDICAENGTDYFADALPDTVPIPHATKIDF